MLFFKTQQDFFPPDKGVLPVEKVQVISSFYLLHATFERKRLECWEICSSIKDFFNRLVGLLNWTRFL
jgi:hypothetical protein